MKEDKYWIFENIVYILIFFIASIQLINLISGCSGNKYMSNREIERRGLCIDDYNIYKYDTKIATIKWTLCNSDGFLKKISILIDDQYSMSELLKFLNTKYPETEIEIDFEEVTKNQNKNIFYDKN
ncbi:MAG: hypothetical protein V3V33_16580 [Candidatus Lokiarchaeia archaeon]